MTKPTIMILFTSLQDETSVFPLSGVVEKVTVVAVLALFLNYFMKELKAVQRLREADKKESDKKFEDIFSHQFETEKKNIEAITRQADTNTALTVAINNLTDKIEKIQK